MHAFMAVNTKCESRERKGPVYWMNHPQSEAFTLTGTEETQTKCVYANV